MRNGVGGRCRQGLSSQLFRTRDVGRGRFGIIAGWGNVDSSCESLPTAPTTPAANTRAKTLVSRLRKAGSRERRTPEGDGFEGGGFRAWELRHDSEAFMDVPPPALSPQRTMDAGLVTPRWPADPRLLRNPYPRCIQV